MHTSLPSVPGSGNGVPSPVYSVQSTLHGVQSPLRAIQRSSARQTNYLGQRTKSFAQLAKPSDWHPNPLEWLAKRSDWSPKPLAWLTCPRAPPARSCVCPKNERTGCGGFNAAWEALVNVSAFRSRRPHRGHLQEATRSGLLGLFPILSLPSARALCNSFFRVFSPLFPRFA
jgi:hypothetical protein